MDLGGNSIVFVFPLEEGEEEENKLTFPVNLYIFKENHGTSNQSIERIRTK